MPEAMTTVDDVVAEARSWVGTRYRHQGRDRSGIDCVGLVIKVAHTLEITEFDLTSYGRVPDGLMLMELADEHMQRVPVSALEPGLIVVMRFATEPQHFAIVAEHPQGGLSLIHALAFSRKVVEHRLDETWSARIVAAYRLPGVA